MSRSRPQLRNPATRRFEWAGSTGRLSWYDKELEENVEVKLPFEFMVLDQKSTITGWNAKRKAQIWSNEVDSVGKEKLFVYTKQGPLEAGLYNQLTEARASGGKYTKVIYIAFQDTATQEWQIGRVMAVGSCLSAWISFAGKHVVEEGKVTMTVGDAEDGPSSQYFPPHFEWEPCGKDWNAIAEALDNKLQQYFDAYKTIPRDEEGQLMAEEVGNDDEPVGSGGLETPTSRSKRAAMPDAPHEGEGWVDPGPTPGQKDDVVIEDIGDEPINLDDIPF